jgi:hypothetical protein
MITYRKPFEPSGKRLKYYIGITIIVLAYVTLSTFNTSTFLMSPDTFFDKYVVPFYIGGILELDKDSNT